MHFNSPTLNLVLMVAEELSLKEAPDCLPCDCQEGKQNSVVCCLGILPLLKL